MCVFVCLFVTSSFTLLQVLRAASQHVTKTLYVHLDPLARTHLPDTTRTLTLYSHIITSIYCCSPSLCHGLDVRVLLAGFKDPTPRPLVTQRPLDVLILEDMGQGKDRLEVEKRYSSCLAAGSQIVVLPELQERDRKDEDKMHLPISVPTDQVYPNVVLGGTFDRPHVGHLVMLSAALLRCSDRLVCGMADGPLLKKKTLTELIKPLQERMAGVVELVRELDPSVECQVMPIEEPLGPTRWDPHMEMIVVSEETKAGVAAINRVRNEKGLQPLEGHVVSLVEDKLRKSDEEETKASSSSIRMRLLGTILREPAPNPTIPAHPYVIGLTGGSASGKSSVGQRLAGLGAAVLDCDKLGHEAYLPGTACHKGLVDAFGPDIVGKDDHIDRRALAAKMFSSESARQRLNTIVWPQIKRLVEQRVAQLGAEGTSVVIIDAALLLEAGWDKCCHQVSLIVLFTCRVRVRKINGLCFLWCHQSSNSDIVFSL